MDDDTIVLIAQQKNLALHRTETEETKDSWNFQHKEPSALRMGLMFHACSDALQLGVDWI